MNKLKKKKFFDFNKIHNPIKKELIKIFSNHIKKSDFTLGKSVLKFEKNFANFNQSKFCIGVSSGTDAILLALKALDIGKGDEVITTSHTWISSIFAISLVGASPVMVDIDYNTFNIDSSLIEKKITKKTKAILPVHMYGLPCNMKIISYIAKKHKLKIIEDCSQAHGSKIININKFVGTYSDISAFSFYPTKNIGALGEAGCCLTNSKRYYDKLIKLRNMGQKARDSHELISSNYKIDAIQASFLNYKLKFLKKWNAERVINAKIYDKLIKNNKIIKPICPKDRKHVYHQYVIKVKNRSKLMLLFDKFNIPYMIHYNKEILSQKVYKNLKFHTPNTTKIYKEILSLPCYPGLSTNQIKKICKIINSF